MRPILKRAAKLVGVHLQLQKTSALPQHVTQPSRMVEHKFFGVKLKWV
jgi:hypothetical protein